MLHAVSAILFKVHVAFQFADGLIVQPQRFLHALLAVAVGVHDALVVIQISQEFHSAVQSFRLLGIQHGGVGQERTVLLPDALQGFREVIVILHGGTIRVADQFTDVRHLETNITEHRVCENIDVEVSLHSIEIFLVGGEDESVVRLSLDAQCHAEHFIPALVPPRFCRRKIAAVGFHILRQQTAGIRNKGAVPGVVIALRVNKEAVCSVCIENEQAVPGVIIVSDSIFVLCDEIIIRQQGTAELLKPLGGQFDDLIHGAGFAFVLGLLSLQFRLNDHVMPPISMRLH